MLGCSVLLASLGSLGLLSYRRLGQSDYYYIFDSTRLVISYPNLNLVLQRDMPSGVNQPFDAAIEGFEGVGETINSQGLPMLLALKKVPDTD